MNSSIDPVNLVVVEDGARVVRPQSWSGSNAAELIVVGGQNLPHGELTQSALRRIALLERSGRRIGRALISIGPRGENPTRASRKLLVRGVLSHLAQHGRGELVLEATTTPDSEIQEELLSLVGALTAELARGSITISMRLAPVGEPQTKPLAKTNGALEPRRAPRPHPTPVSSSASGPSTARRSGPHG